MNPTTRRRLPRYLIAAQLGIYLFIAAHAVLWHVLGFHVIGKLCPFVFAEHVGHLELNLVVAFWALVYLSTLFVGRAFCAWGCMFGAFQDFVSRIATRLGAKPARTRATIWLLRIIVTVLIVGIISGSSTYWPTFFWFVAAVVAVGLVMWLLVDKPRASRVEALPRFVYLASYLGAVIALWITLNVFHHGITIAFDNHGVFQDEKWAGQIALAVLVAVAIVLVEKRVFCKYLCPIGLLLRFSSGVPSPWRFKVRATEAQCTQCERCNAACLMGLEPMNDTIRWGEVRNPDCITCLECVSKCPKGAIDFSRAARVPSTAIQPAAVPSSAHV
jgi:polyferredoxin